MTFLRWLLLRWNIIESETEKDEINQTAIAGTEQEFNEVNLILQQAGLHERILGRIDPHETAAPKTIGSFNQLKSLLKIYPLKEIIFCEGVLSFKQIIDVMPEIPAGVRRKLFASGLHFLIGGAGKSATGNYISRGELVHTNDALFIRNKRLSDFIIALFFLITFPFHIVAKSKPLHFYKNVFKVVFQKKTWIGYSLPENQLSPLKPGILTTTGLPAALNTLPDESLRTTDKIYRKNFHILTDIKIVSLNYKFLSC
jgi:hypothetical protein